MKPTLRWLLAGLCFALSLEVYASDDRPARTLFTDVAVFNGTDEKLYEGLNVLVEANRIAQISSEAIAANGATVIEGGGRTLMPGLIDGHAHMMINANFADVERDMDVTDLAYRASLVVERFLMDEDEIFKEALWAYEAEYGSCVIQSGERQDETYISMIERVRVDWFK